MDLHRGQEIVDFSRQWRWFVFWVPLKALSICPTPSDHRPEVVKSRHATRALGVQLNRYAAEDAGEEHFINERRLRYSLGAAPRARECLGG